MTVYLIAVAVAGLLCIAGIWGITALYGGEWTICHKPPENTPQPPIQPQAGDYSTLEPGSIEGECHVRVL